MSETVPGPFVIDNYSTVLEFEPGADYLRHIARTERRDRALEAFYFETKKLHRDTLYWPGGVCREAAEAAILRFGDLVRAEDYCGAAQAANEVRALNPSRTTKLATELSIIPYIESGGNKSDFTDTYLAPGVESPYDLIE